MWLRSARSFNWSLSLLALLSMIVFVIPLGLCLLLTHRTRPTASRTLFLTLIPFAAYLVLFYKLGSLVASKFVVEGSHSLGRWKGRYYWASCCPKQKADSPFPVQATSTRSCRVCACRACS